jgi:hypothetical protein
MKTNLIVLLVTLAVVATACGGTSAIRAADGTLEPVPESVRDLDARAALAQANAWYSAGTGVTSYVDTRVIGFEFDGGDKVEIPLPDDEMVVAVAPYVERTHPCATHFMSGCQGELVGVPVQVIARAADGTILIDAEIETLPNGFIELWLPRDQEVDLELSARGKSAREIISTAHGSNTCITTMQLSS